MRALIALEAAMPAIAALLALLTFCLAIAPAFGAIIWRFG